eukprot:TRINITY_DN101662_c0_g1_i1.p1 TRINITY_DN101662_c0_g1~~TRINITY_DN101662_c0_g1_i1.p1  ORF type:complete len:414 (+),score=131.61 TRINITY_DN101662_c0_g1_i1:102-1244(+)
MSELRHRNVNLDCSRDEPASVESKLQDRLQGNSGLSLGWTIGIVVMACTITGFVVREFHAPPRLNPVAPMKVTTGRRMVHDHQGEAPETLEEALEVLEKRGGKKAARGATGLWGSQDEDVEPADDLERSEKLREYVEKMFGPIRPPAANDPAAKKASKKKAEKKRKEKRAEPSAKAEDAASKEDEEDDEAAAAAESEEADTSHIDFAKLLQEEKDTKPEHHLKDVKAEFKAEYKADTKPLMCSGCKLIASRFGADLREHEVHDQDSPHLMLAAKRRAINAACKSFRHMDVVRDGEGKPRFEAVPASESEEKKRIGQRLCEAVLEDARFDVLAKMMHAKIPHMAHVGAHKHTNWERFLCAQHTRLCKRSDTKEEDEEEDDD